MAKKRIEKDIQEEMYDRVKIVYGIFIVIGICVIARLIWVMLPITETATNAARLESRIYLTDTVISRRGAILARDGEPLATSILRYRIDFDMGSEGFDDEEAFRENVDSLSKLLAGFFKKEGYSAAEYRRRMLEERKRHCKWVYSHDSLVRRSSDLLTWIVDNLRGDEVQVMKVDTAVRDHHPVQILPRAVDFNEWQELSKYPILNGNMGITFKKHILDQRVYPYGELGRRTLGRVTQNVSKEDKQSARGQYGLENVYAEYLRGQNGRMLRQRIAPGFSAAIHSDSNIVASDGEDIVTTLDIDIQHAADAALRRQLTAQKASWGTTMVMEVKTGDILAMVNLGETAPQSGIYYEKENYALARRIEPGSTFKLVSLLALTEDCGLPITQEYQTYNGRTTIIGKGGPKVTDDHNIGGMVDMKTATAQSSNVYFADAIYQNYNKDRKRYINFLHHLYLDRDLGFTNMEEKEVRIPDPDKKTGVGSWSAHTLPNMGYGYAIEMPPIRTLVLYNAVANGGKMMAPRLIKEIRRGDEVEEKFAPRVLVDKICSDKALAIVQECLEETARTGTTKRYFTDSLTFRVGSKTGTAIVAQDGNGNGAPYGSYYLATVVAYFPADNPKYTVMTAIHTDRRRGHAYYGASLAGPVVEQVVDYIYYRDEEWHQKVPASQQKYSPVKVKGGNIAQVRRVADKFSPRVSFTDRNGWGVAKMDTLKNVDITTIEDNALMPNVVGMGLKDALYILESRGLDVHFTGRGTVRSQSIPVGRKITAGQSVNLMLR
ncbi:MAG: transpeptidase family protein [Alistipes sp.]|nr:transpeptidase family protein [Alistipes sp.]